MNRTFPTRAAHIVRAVARLPVRFARAIALATGFCLVTTLPAAADPIVVEEVGRGPYAIEGVDINVTVGRSLSRVVARYKYVYVRAFDSTDRRDPVLIDVPVVVRRHDVDPGKILKLVNVQLRVGRHGYQPRDVLMLDHEAIEPVPELPDSSRIAMVSFNIPRQGLKARFQVRITYDQPHLPGPTGGELSIVVPLLPDFDQLQTVLRSTRDDFVVKFAALPEIRLRRDSINAHVLSESPESIVVHPRNRESITVEAESADLAPAPAGE